MWMFIHTCTFIHDSLLIWLCLLSLLGFNWKSWGHHSHEYLVLTGVCLALGERYVCGWLDSGGTSCLCSLWCSVFEEVVTSLLVFLGFWALDQRGTLKIKIFFSCIHRLLTFQICSLMLSPNVFGHIHSYPRMHETCGLHTGIVWNMNTGGPEAKRSLYPSPESSNEELAGRTVKGYTYENKIICGHFSNLFYPHFHC